MWWCESVIPELLRLLERKKQETILEIWEPQMKDPAPKECVKRKLAPQSWPCTHPCPCPYPFTKYIDPNTYRIIIPFFSLIGSQFNISTPIDFKHECYSGLELGTVSATIHSMSAAQTEEPSVTSLKVRKVFSYFSVSGTSLIPSNQERLTLKHFL